MRCGCFCCAVGTPPKTKNPNPSLSRKGLDLPCLVRVVIQNFLKTIVVQFIFETIGWQFACITSRWAAVLKKQLPSIPIISVHGLRHTHASVLLFAGVSIASVVALTLFTLQKKRGSVQSKTLLVFFRSGCLISYATLKA